MNELMTTKPVLDPNQLLLLTAKETPQDQIINTCYTVIYRGLDGTLSEAWHNLDQDGIEWCKNNYKKANKIIVEFIEKKLPFGEYLKTISGSSKAKGA